MQTMFFLKIVNWIEMIRLFCPPLPVVSAGKGSEEAALVRILVDLSGDKMRKRTWSCEVVAQDMSRSFIQLNSKYQKI